MSAKWSLTMKLVVDGFRLLRLQTGAYLPVLDVTLNGHKEEWGLWDIDGCMRQRAEEALDRFREQEREP